MRGKTARPNGSAVLLLGTGQPSAHATARSLHRAGYVVLGAREPSRLTGLSRYCREIFEIPSPSDHDGFTAAVNEICVRESIDAILPLADEMLGALLREQTADVPWVVVGPSPDHFRLLCDKRHLGETAARAGVRTPSFVTVRPDDVPAEFPPLPGYVKVIPGAVTGRPDGRPRRVGDELECRAVVAALIEEGRSLIVQEEIIGEQWRLHFARVCGVTAHLSARTWADYPPRTGQSTVSQFGTTPIALAQAALPLVESIDYEGVGSLQFIRRDRVWYVHDVNLRMPASVGGTVAAGLDLPRLAVEIALGRQRPPERPEIRSLRFVQLIGEASALRAALTTASAGRSAGRIAAEIVLAALLPTRMVEPLDLRDPLPTLAAIASTRSRRTGLRDRVSPREGRRHG